MDEIADPGVVILRRPDGSAAAVFSAMGATSEAVEEAAWEDYRSGE